MNKINNKLIIFGLGILAILAFSVMVFVPTETKAYSNGDSYWRYQASPNLNVPAPIISSINPDSVNGIQSKVTITITGNGFTPNSIVRKNNSNRVTTFIDSQHLMVDIYAGDMYNQNDFFLTVFNSDGQYSNALTFTIKNNTTTTITNTNNNSSSNTTTNTTNTTISKTTDTSNTVAANDTNNSYSGLTANVLEGSNSFLPTGLLQWIFLAIIVVAIIFLWRYVFRSEDKYLSEPLKHA
ncbi:MAG: hypothetical protein AAB913_01565 [Patescibacteria group bacterium]